MEHRWQFVISDVTLGWERTIFWCARCGALTNRLEKVDGKGRSESYCAPGDEGKYAGFQHEEPPCRASTDTNSSTS